MSYGTSVTVRAPFAETVTRVRAALAGQGFGVLTEIGLQQCAHSDDAASEADRAQLERLFLSLA